MASVFGGRSAAPSVVWQVTNGTTVGTGAGCEADVAGVADAPDAAAEAEWEEAAGADDFGAAEHAATPATSASVVNSAVSQDKRRGMAALLGTPRRFPAKRAGPAHQAPHLSQWNQSHLPSAHDHENYFYHEAI